MSDKFMFQNARIKAMESRLLTSQHLQRLVDCTSVDDAFKILLELGFGQGLTLGNGDFDTLFAKEEESAVNILKTFNVSNTLDAFLLDADYHNVKALLKAEITKDNPVLMSEGLFSVEAIKSAIAGDTSNVSNTMANVINDIMSAIASNTVTSRLIDTIVDKAMFVDELSYAKQGGKLVKDYFVRKIDYANISAFVRCKKLGQSKKFFDQGFIEGGQLDFSCFDGYEQGVDAFREKVKNTPYESLAIKLIDDENLVEYEVAVDNAQLKAWKDEFNDLFSPAPIIYYYFAKKTELKVVKLVVAGIKNHVEPSLIKERMREIYGA